MATRKKNSGSQNRTAVPSKDKPVRVVRLRNIRGNIWANRLPSGDLVYNVTIDRLWKDDDQMGSGTRASPSVATTSCLSPRSLIYATRGFIGRFRTKPVSRASDRTGRNALGDIH